MKLENNKLTASEGLYLRRKGTSFIIGPSITLAKWDGKDDVPSNFEEVIPFLIGYKNIGIYPTDCEDKDSLISALVGIKYSKEEELTLLNNTIADGVNDAFNEYKDWRNECINVADSYFSNNEPTLAKAKSAKIKEIEEYDASDSVNSFTYNGVPMWIGLELRKNITHDINVLKAKNIEEFTFWNNGTALTFPIAVLENLLVEIEIYALNCFNVTAQHKANVEALETIEEVNAYDYTTGYPNKLEL